MTPRTTPTLSQNHDLKNIPLKKTKTNPRMYRFGFTRESHVQQAPNPRRNDGSAKTRARHRCVTGQISTPSAPSTARLQPALQHPRPPRRTLVSFCTCTPCVYATATMTPRPRPLRGYSAGFNLNLHQLPASFVQNAKFPPVLAGLRRGFGRVLGALWRNPVAPSGRKV